MFGCEVEQTIDQVNDPTESTEEKEQTDKDQEKSNPQELDDTTTSRTDPPKEEDGQTEKQSSISTPTGELKVHYIDVGQGDATLLQGPDFTILIDAGRHNRNDVVPYLQNQGIEIIDLLIATHPHADHIGQMDKVMENFSVKEVWMSGDEHTSKTFERVIDAILASSADYHEPRAGEVHKFGSAILEVINPDRLTGEFHEGSVSVRVIYGDLKLLFTGDAEDHTEQDILNRDHDVKADIFQLGHHGSRTSNSLSFFEVVQPQVAIYSAGDGNSYGHPHQEVVNRINNIGLSLYGTDFHGTIVVTTDGKTYDVTTQKSGEISVNEHKEESSERQETKEENTSHDCVDINTAFKSELTEIIHIGDKRAEQLIRLRPFHSVNDLTRISGIGDGRLADIKEQGIACVN
jgi:competence protein ComEC